MIAGSPSNVLDFGADSTGVSSSVTAFNNALLNGGTVYVPSGSYKLDSKVSISIDNTCLFLAANVTLTLSGVAAIQTPIGNQINVTGSNCSIIGSGASSFLQMSGGSKANAIGLYQGDLLTVSNLAMDGDKANVSGSGFTDDTFGVGIAIICTTDGGAATDARVLIDNVWVKNFFNYGISLYGEQANGIKIVNCNIEGIGVSAEANSVGAGIVSSISPVDIIIANNVIKGCKFHGIFIYPGFRDSNNFTITGNTIHQNGYTANHGSGICLTSTPDYYGTVGKGLYNVSITGNVCTGNSRSGITVNVDTLGYVKYVTITGNTLEGNTYAGIDFGCTNTTPNIISNVMVSGNQIASNGSYQIITSSFVTLIEGVPMPFTPSISGTTIAGVGTYTAQYGVYTKVGNIVNFELDCSWSAHTGTGNIQVNGFPYASANANPISASWVWASDLVITGQATLGITQNQTYGPLGAINNGVYSTVAIDTSAALRITGFYFTT